MNKQAIHVSVNKPCNQDWGQMSPVDAGRFCNACDKIVTDFSSMSDEELLSFFAKQPAGAQPCGHFRKDQLNKTITVPEPRKAFKFFRLAASFLLAQALLYQEKAFGKTKPQIEVVSPAEITGDRDITITGRVLDYHSDNPVAGLKVYVDSTELYAITDKNGRFAITVPKTTGGTITLQTAYINNEGYVAGSIILAIPVNTEETAGKELILYRYPEERLEELWITEYKVPLISGGYTVTGAPMTIIGERKENFWYRITKIFRKK